MLSREEEGKAHRLGETVLTTFQKSSCFGGSSLLRTSRTMLSTSQTWSRTQSRRRSRRGPALCREDCIVSSQVSGPKPLSYLLLTLMAWQSLSEVYWLDFYLPQSNYKGSELLSSQPVRARRLWEPQPADRIPGGKSEQHHSPGENPNQKLEEIKGEWFRS